MTGGAKVGTLLAVTLVAAFATPTAASSIGSQASTQPAGGAVLGPLAAVERSVAAGYALVVHAAILLPMIVLGQAILWAGHISLGRLSRQEAVAAPSPASGWLGAVTTAAWCGA